MGGKVAMSAHPFPGDGSQHRHGNGISEMIISEVGVQECMVGRLSGILLNKLQYLVVMGLWHVGMAFRWVKIVEPALNQGSEDWHDHEPFFLQVFSLPTFAYFCTH